MKAIEIPPFEQSKKRKRKRKKRLKDQSPFETKKDEK